MCFWGAVVMCVGIGWWFGVRKNEWVVCACVCVRIASKQHIPHKTYTYTYPKVLADVSVAPPLGGEGLRHLLFVWSIGLWVYG